jgi:Legume lectin domain
MTTKSRIMTTIVVLASIVVSKTGAREYIFNDFSNTNNLTLNGNAFVTNTPDGNVIRLVNAQFNQSGSFFSSLPIQATTYSASFKFRITNPGGSADPAGEAGGDGLAFVVQSITNSIGGSGGGIGYYGIGSSVDVEFDTWMNVDINDPDSNHLGINTNGVINHGPGAPYTLGMSPHFDDGNLWYAWVDYDGTNVQISANETGIRPKTAYLSRPLDVVELLGQTNAFVGFTSGTYGAWENVDVISFDYRDNYNPIFTTNQVPVSIRLAPQISWLSDTNAHYQVQAMSDLNTNWIDLGSPIQGNGTTNYFFDPFGGNSKKFYRVMTRP